MRRTLHALAWTISSLATPAILPAQYQWTLVVGNGAKPANYRTQTIERFSFVCLPNLPIQSVYGTDVYTDDSNICSAAVHAGVITRARGGPVTLVIKDGHTVYEGSSRNGITSEKYYKDYDRGYSFVSDGGGVLDWRTTAGQLPRSYTTPIDLVCPKGSEADLQQNPVFGSGIYKDDSSICGAAVHSGAITLAGGPIRLVPRGPQMSFAGSAKNGVTSKLYGTYEGSFSLGDASRVGQTEGKTPTDEKSGRGNSQPPGQTEGKKPGQDDKSLPGAPPGQTAGRPNTPESGESSQKPAPLGTPIAPPPIGPSGPLGPASPSGPVGTSSLSESSDRIDALIADVIRNGNTMSIETLDSIIGAIGVESDEVAKRLAEGWKPLDGQAGIARFGIVVDSLESTIARIAYNRLPRVWINNSDTHVFPLLGADDMSIHQIPNLHRRGWLVPTWTVPDPACSAILGSTPGPKVGVNVPFSIVDCRGSRRLLMTISGPPGSIPATRVGEWFVGS